MPTTTGTITNIKLSSFLTGTVNSFATCMVTLLGAGTGVSWLLVPVRNLGFSTESPIP